MRNLEILAGRFFDDEDSMSRAHVAAVTQQFAQRVYQGQGAAVGKDIKINGLPFVIIGTFRERVETFGQSEIAGDTILIPYNVARYFTGSDAVKQVFFSVSDAGDVPRATEMIKQVLQSRHRPASVYRVENLTQILQVAARAANGLTLMLLGISLLVLIVSGVGIMNIMLANVRTRIREIGIRKAIGATSREIRLQFLTEAILISLAGGIVGTILGLALPFSVRFLTEYRIPISGLSAIIAIISCCAGGRCFRNAAGNPRGPVGSGGSVALRISNQQSPNQSYFSAGRDHDREVRFPEKGWPRISRINTNQPQGLAFDHSRFSRSFAAKRVFSAISQ